MLPCGRHQARNQYPSFPHAPQSSVSVIELQTPAQIDNMPTAITPSETLAKGQDLVQHWETLNGCANSEMHIIPQMLFYLTQSISWVVRDYEVAVDAIISQRTPLTARPEAVSSICGSLLPWDNNNSSSNDNSASKENSHERRIEPGEIAMTPASIIPRAYVGNLELDPDEAVLVAQEAFRHSIARLTIMLQDIEEEEAILRYQPEGSSQQQIAIEEPGDEEYIQRERNRRDLITRLLKLLSRVDGLGYGGSESCLGVYSASLN